jgi:hypothetical protein
VSQLLDQPEIASLDGALKKGSFLDEFGKVDVEEVPEERDISPDAFEDFIEIDRMIRGEGK